MGADLSPEISTKRTMKFQVIYPEGDLKMKRRYTEEQIINGLIRQYLPQKIDFKPLTRESIQYIQNKLNNRPRKCLGFKTPNQMLFGVKPPVVLAT